MLINPAAFLITSEGTHELTRCYYQDGKYVVGPSGLTRLGQYTCVGADLEPDGQLRLTFTGGYRVLVPDSRVQLTYRV